MAETIKGIKTADNVVHKISGTALSFGRACLWDTDKIKYAVPFILGHDYSEVPVGSELTFYYYDSNETAFVEQTLKAHKTSDSPKTLYFSPEFSDSNLYITSSDLNNIDFYIYFAYSPTAGSSSYIYNYSVSDGRTVGLLVDALTAALAYELETNCFYLKVKDQSEETEEVVVTDQSSWSDFGGTGASSS